MKGNYHIPDQVPDLDDKNRADLEDILKFLCEDYRDGNIKSFQSFCFSAILVARDFQGRLYGRVSEVDRANLLMKVLTRSLEEKPPNLGIRVPRGLREGLMEHLDFVAGRSGAIRRREDGGPRFMFDDTGLHDPDLEPSGEAATQEERETEPTSAYSYGAKLLRRYGFAKATPALIKSIRKAHKKKQAG